jgi:benzylsuccinate CoA-transferase BbsF subunit
VSGGLILKSIRILDFSWVLAGPYATRLLADFGAEVIKIQPLSAEAGDRYSRGYYNTWNRNKLGITLNLNQPGGVEIAKRLVKISDAVVENFSPRVMANWGLSYSDLKTLKPDIIVLSLSILGHTGPWRDYTGFGPTAQAFSGITSLTAYAGQPPAGIGFSYADHVAALYACLAFMGALEYRLKTGKGQYIDLSETEATTGLLSEAIRDYTLAGREPQAAGNNSDEIAPQGVYSCRGNDRWCAISVTAEGEWASFKRAVGHPLWAEDASFATPDDRRKNREALDSFIQDWTQVHAAEEVMAIMQQEGVPAGVVQNASDLVHDPQLKSRGFFFSLDHPVLGNTTADSSPIRLSGNPAQYRRAAPVPGQDNEYVYGGLLGLSESEINKLRKEEII